MKFHQILRSKRKELGLTQQDIADIWGIKSVNVSDWENAKGMPETARLPALAKRLNLTISELMGEKNISNQNEKNIEYDFDVIKANDTDKGSKKIEYWDVRGSCGGGFLNHEQLPKGYLIKEDTFFAKYGLKAENAFAIYADGDSMAEFIVDGDIVIFDKSKTQPISGQIFAIEHPDGLKIKVIRRSIDGSWTLESKNQDKRSFPDEVIPAGHTDLLKIHGQFVYRQGG